MAENNKAILLLSGGFDSGVAGYLVDKNEGYEIIPLHLSNVDFVGDWTIKKCMTITKMFGWKKIYVVDIADALEEFVNKCKHSYFFVLMKRLMLVIASQIAIKENASYIITGESLGQVSSQTLANISVIEEITKIRVLKPLIAMDKETIINYSQKIGTFDISSGPEVCDVLGPKHPITKATLNQVLEEEKKLDYSSLVSRCLEKTKVILSN